MSKIRLIFVIGIPILIRRLYIEMVPRVWYLASLMLAASSMSLGFPGYRQQCIIWFHSCAYVIIQYFVIVDCASLKNTHNIEDFGAWARSSSIRSAPFPSYFCLNELWVDQSQRWCEEFNKGLAPGFCQETGNSIDHLSNVFIYSRDFVGKWRRELGKGVTGEFVVNDTMNVIVAAVVVNMFSLPLLLLVSLLLLLLLSLLLLLLSLLLLSFLLLLLLLLSSLL